MKDSFRPNISQVDLMDIAVIVCRGSNDLYRGHKNFHITPVSNS